MFLTFRWKLVWYYLFIYFAFSIFTIGSELHYLLFQCNIVNKVTHRITYYLYLILLWCDSVNWNNLANIIQAIHLLIFHTPFGFVPFLLLLTFLDTLIKCYLLYWLIILFSHLQFFSSFLTYLTNWECKYYFVSFIYYTRKLFVHVDKYFSILLFK